MPLLRAPGNRSSALSKVSQRGRRQGYSIDRELVGDRPGLLQEFPGGSREGFRSILEVAL